MQKKVTCIGAGLKKKEWIGDNFEDREGKFVFSIADSSSIPGRPKEQHTIRVKITGELLWNWRLAQSSEDVLTKVLFYYAMEHVRQKLEVTWNGALPESDELTITTKNHTERRCPVGISEIHKVVGFDFGVDLEVREDERASQLLEKCLEDFANYIQSEKRMTFWRSGDIEGRKWVSRPEAHAKNLLHTFLSGRFGDFIYTFEEITFGAGKVDLFVVSPNKEDIVVELKMCGHDYSTAYAQEGKEQLLHYMKNKGTQTGYLLVFDSRVRDFAQGFQENETIGGMSITTIVADVRPYVKQKEAPSNV